MNKERLIEVRDAIQAQPEYFDYSVTVTTFGAHYVDIGNECGTAGCVAGWAAKLYGDSDVKSACSFAKRVLELTEEQSRFLFSCAAGFGEPQLDYEDPVEAGYGEAVKRLNILINL